MTRADVIFNAFASHELIEPLSGDDPGHAEDAAYAVAAEIHRWRVAGGAKPVGRKIGFTNRALSAQYGATPMWGYVYDSTLLRADGAAAVPVGGLLQPRIEPEIQLHFARTPPVTNDEEAILDCVDWIAHGFEVVQCPYPDWKFARGDAIAAAGLHGLLVVGPSVLVSDIDDCAAKLRRFTVTLLRDGVAEATGSGGNVLDSPLLAFAHLGEILAAQSRPEPVQAGEVVTTGSLTAAPLASAGETWSTTIEGIELPGLSVTLVERSRPAPPLHSASRWRPLPT